MSEICSACSHDPSCTTQSEMQARHGTPAEFRAAVMRALGEFISWQEAQSAIRQYERDFMRAPKRAVAPPVSEPSSK
jgi:hypothetical protein